MKRGDNLAEQLRVYFVVGSQDCDFSAAKTVEIAREALAGGAGVLQFRDKKSKLNDREREQLAGDLQALCKEYGALFFINDDVEMAIRLQADGIHVGQEDMALTQVRTLVSTDMLIGVSAGTVAEALLARDQGADYIGVGAMFATASKADAGEPIGPAGLKEIRAAVGPTLPIVGIGGITIDNAPSVLEAGADGVAIISAITKAESPREAAGRFQALF
ncbi:thiamine phosphate synthase [Brevibacillus migulae]|uniref:thiamine phosphate synthase n=1 Tax=Brevibacillus migulae TaxID=1644114 RepID=UPI00106EB6E0|nr:thiamine phosphate synthase [Brevibacillus migulae]